jgi:hypothetical protein
LNGITIVLEGYLIMSVASYQSLPRDITALVQGSKCNDCMLDKSFLLRSLKYNLTPEGYIEILGKAGGSGISEYFKILKFLIVGEQSVRRR